MRIPPTSLADRDDVASAAMIGLIAAVDRFDHRRGVPFEAYASLRIRGAVVDELRRVDERGRADRRSETAALAVSLDEIGRAPWRGRAGSGGWGRAEAGGLEAEPAVSG